MREKPVQQRIQVTASALGLTLFRNNTGFDEVRRVRYGLCPGSPDLVGWTPLIIGGRRVAVFTAIECKRSSGGIASPEQLNFIAQVRAAGGLGAVVSDPDTLPRLIQEYIDEQA